MRILMVGFGSIGQRHFQNLNALGYHDFLFLRSYRGTVPSGAAEKYPAYATLKEALAHEPDVVFVTNPTAFHLETAIAVLESGCHLFLEKPMASILNGCERMCQLARKKRKTAMVGFQFRYHPGLLRLQEGLEKDRIGRILFASASYGDYLPDWHPWENYKQSYASRTELGGGALLTLCHPIDYLIWLLGEPDGVHGFLSSRHPLGLQVDEAAFVSMQFRSGAIGSVQMNFIEKPAKHEMKLIGEKGSVHLDFQDNTLEWKEKNGSEVVSFLNFERNQMFLDEVKAFMKAVEAKQTAPVPLEAGLSVQRVIEVVKSKKMGL